MTDHNARQAGLTQFPEGFDETCGIPAWAMQAANMTAASLTGNRAWDVPCIARAILAAHSADARKAGQWNLFDPSGKIVATEASCVKAWARIDGYKPTVEGLLGYEQKGWHVDPVSVSADARNGEGVALSGWIAVADSLPTAEKDYLVKGIKHSGLYHDIAGLFHGKWMSQVTQDECKFEVSHWMPLPTLAAPAAPAPKCKACGSLAHTGMCQTYVAPAPAAQADGKDDGRVMMSAHALCPTDMPHPDRMRWMARYFREHAAQQSATPADAASEADKRDAERYRWLRERADVRPGLTDCQISPRKVSFMQFPALMTENENLGADEIMDAAIQRERQQGADK